MTITPGLNTHQLIWRFLRPHKWSLISFLVVAVVWAAELSISPYLLKLIIDGVSSTANAPEKLLAAITIPAVLYVSLSVLLNVIFRLYGAVRIYLFSELRKTLISKLYQYVSQHSYHYFQQNFSGSLASKIKDVTNGIDLIITIPTEVFIPRTIAALIAAAILATVTPLLSLVLFGWTILFTIITYAFAKSTEKLSLPYSEQSAQLDGQITDSLSNIVTTKLFAQERYEISRMKSHLKHVISLNKKVIWNMEYARLAQGIMVTLLITLMLTILITERRQGLVTVGDFAFVLTLLVSISMQIWDLGQQIVRYSNETSKVQQALNIMLVPHGITNLANAVPMQIVNGAIECRNLTFCYTGRQTLFSNLNVKITPGQKVGLVGPSGGGKSSFIKLLMRLYDLNDGDIIIDGVSINRCTKASLREQIAIIPQDPDMFNRTILENIRYAKPNASFDEVKNAARKAHCDEFIDQLEHGYDTLVGERGVKLSGGQKQRIAIARAILKNAPILIFDEATSALDSQTEKYIQNSLHEMMQHKTTLVIAHRLSTLSEMDRILYFKDGRIIEDGSLEELIKRNGEFTKLWQMQSSGYLP